jgi:hypothetical protein
VGRRQARIRHGFEQPGSYHNIVENGRKNRAIPLIWQSLFDRLGKGCEFKPL